MTGKYAEWNRGQEEALLNTLGGIHGAKEVLRGHRVAVANRHFIDCDKDPFVPANMRLTRHRKGGVYEIIPANIKRFLIPDQSKPFGVRGGQIREEIFNASESSQIREGAILNVNVLDYLLADTKIIPEYLKPADTTTIYALILCFWGTEYEDLSFSNRPCIRGLRWSKYTGSWEVVTLYIDLLFHEWQPTARYGGTG